MANWPFLNKKLELDFARVIAVNITIYYLVLRCFQLLFSKQQSSNYRQYESITWHSDLLELDSKYNAYLIIVKFLRKM